MVNVKKSYCYIFKDVKEDFEIQAWVHDIAHEGFGWFDGNTRGMPDKIDTFDQLVSLWIITNMRLYVKTAWTGLVTTALN